MKSYGVSNQLKPPKQYCHMLLLVCLFVFSHSLLCGQRATPKLFSFWGLILIIGQFVFLVPGNSPKSLYECKLYPVS